MRRITPPDTWLIHPHVLLYSLTYVGVPALNRYESKYTFCTYCFKKHYEQECIPVRCIPTAAVAAGRGVSVRGDFVEGRSLSGGEGDNIALMLF